MTRILIYIALALGGVFVGPQLMQNKGYLMLTLGEYTVETTIVGAGIVILAAVALLQLVEFILFKLIGLTGYTLRTPKRWRQNRARKHTLIGAMALAEQDWAAAEKAMAKGAKAGEMPLINYLSAARAAHHKGDRAACEAYLQEAEQQPEAANVVAIARLRYLIDDGLLSEARQSFDNLAPHLRIKPQVLRLALDLYRRQQDWDALARLVPALTSHKVLSEQELAALPVEIEVACLEQSQEFDTLMQRWQALPRKLKRQDPIVVAYAQGLARFGHTTEGRKALMGQLNKHEPQPQLLAALPAMVEDASESVIHVLERKYPKSNSLELMDCYATLAERNNAWDSAKLWREKAIEQSPSAERYQALAQLQEQLGQSEEALNSYRKLLGLSVS